MPYAAATHALQASENQRRALTGAKPLPYSGEPARDRELWIVTEEDGVQHVRFSDAHKLYVNEVVWQQTDLPGRTWEASDIIGWADDYEAVRSFEARSLTTRLMVEG